MTKGKIALIVGISVTVLVGVLVTLSLLQDNGEGKPNTNNNPLTQDIALTEADKTQIRSHTNEFLSRVATYGWFQSTITNPDNALRDTEFFMAQDHIDAADVASTLAKLTNSTEYAELINKDIFMNPFSVETVPTAEWVVPSSPVTEGGETYIQVIVPVESTLIYLSVGINHYDSDGNFVPADVSIDRNVFEGEITFKFVRSGSDWKISLFNQTVGVLPLDEVYFPNGDLYTTTTPVRTDSIPVRIADE